MANMFVSHRRSDTQAAEKLAERTLKRRFTSATGITPIDYVQQLRIPEFTRPKPSAARGSGNEGLQKSMK